MDIKINHDAVAKVNAATLQGKTPSQIKPIYIEQNAFNVDLDAPIYRIFQWDYLKHDINSKTLTHVKACPDVWGDEFENPLLKAEYTDDVTGGKIHLNGLVDDFHALSWTIDETEKKDVWSMFSHGKPSIRVKTTARKLLDKLMNTNDRYFMLHHHIGKVQYEKEQDILDWLNNSDYTTHLDSIGQRLSLSLMLLRTIFSSEQEIRLLYSYKPQEDNPWVEKEIIKNDKTCTLPFEWDGAIDQILLGETMGSSDENELINTLKNSNLNCNIESSKFR